MADEKTPRPITPAKEEPSPDILRPAFDPEQLPHLENLKTIDSVVGCLKHLFTIIESSLDKDTVAMLHAKMSVLIKLTDCLSKSLRFAHIDETYLKRLIDIIYQINSDSFNDDEITVITRLLQVRGTAEELSLVFIERMPNEEGIDIDNLELYKVFFHLIKNLQTIPKGYLSMLVDDYPDLTLEEIPNDSDIKSIGVPAVLSYPSIIMNALEIWSGVAHLFTDTNSWIGVEQLVNEIATLTDLRNAVKLKNNHENLEKVQVPKNVIGAAVLELIVNSKQVASLREIQDAHISLNLEITDTTNLPLLLVQFIDKAGGFKDTNITPGTTTREGGTGTGLTVVFKLIQDTLGGIVDIQNWGDDGEGNPIGAKITLSIPLHPTTQKTEESSAEETQPDFVANPV